MSADITPEMATELWHFPFSHFNEKVRWALDHKGWPHRRHTLAPGFHIPRALSLSGQGATPILRDGQHTLHDSTAIIAYLESARPDPPLYPEDHTLRRRALELEDWFDENAGDDVRRLFYDAHASDPAGCAQMSTVGTSDFQQRAFRALMPVLRHVLHAKMKLSAERVARARNALPTFFDKIADELGPSGYLVGDTFTVADLTAASMLSLIVLPEQFPYALPDGAPAELLSLRQSFEKHPAFQWVRDVYKRHRSERASRPDA